MLKKLLLLSFIIVLNNLTAEEALFLKNPAISPDGEEVSFVYRGDIWKVPFTGGKAVRISDTPGEEENLAYSPDGKYLAFNSYRNGYKQIFLRSEENGETKAVSGHRVSLLEWFPDSKTLLVSKYSLKDNLERSYYTLNIESKKLKRLKVAGGSFAQVNEEGKIIFNLKGYTNREKYRGSQNGDLYLFDPATEKISRLTRSNITERYPVFKNKNEIVYAKTKDGSFQLCQSTITENTLKNETFLTDFKEKSVRDLSISKNGQRVVFELFDKLGFYDFENNKQGIIVININDDLFKNDLQYETIQNSAKLVAVSDSSKWLAFSYKYDLFAVSNEGGKAFQITEDQAGIEDFVIMSDKYLFFTKLVKGTPTLFYWQIDKPGEKPAFVEWSDGKYIEYLKKDQNDLIISYSTGDERFRQAVLKLTEKEEIDFYINIIADDKVIQSASALSPNRKFAAYTEVLPEYYGRRLYLKDLNSNQEKMVFAFDDSDLANLYWLDNQGTILLTKKSKIIRLDLNYNDDFFGEKDHWQNLQESFRREEKEKKTWNSELKIQEAVHNSEVKYKDIIDRKGYNYVIKVNNDSTFYYLNYHDEVYTLRKADIFGKKDDFIRSFSADIYQNKANFLHYSVANNKFYFVENSQIKWLNPDNSNSGMLDFNFAYEYSRQKLFEKTFDQIWCSFGREFYDKEMHGVNWDDMYERFHPYVEKCYTASSFQTIIDEMIGEVNSSHSEYYALGDYEYKSRNLAYTGLEFDFYNRPLKGITVSRIYRSSVLYLKYGIRTGDILLSIDGIKITDKSILDDLLKDKLGERIKLTFKTKTDETVSAEIKGLNWNRNYDMFYDDEVEKNFQKVQELSKERIGYLHIQEMDDACYEKFLQDLFAKNFYKDALIIDIRGNGGGNISDQIIEVLTRRKYSYTNERIFNSKRVPFPQYIWQKPLVLLVNEESFSDAECLPIYFQELKLGKVIGTPTSGYVIGTVEKELLDGSELRLPTDGQFRLDGSNMENSGCRPDIIVEESLEDIIEGKDKQLNTAVEYLLEELRK